MAAATRIILCADDYAMSEGVSRGIVRLALSGRVSATSVMAGSPHWPAVAGALGAVASDVSVGLHLTLTWGRPLGPMPRLAPGGAFPPLGTLVRDALLGRLPRAELQAEIGRQLDRFEDVWGAPPAFIDGHQHVHALPGIRSALLAVASGRGLAGTAWLRDPSDRPATIVRRGGAWAKALVAGTLSSGFGEAARRAGFATNRGFAGFSSFAADLDLDRAFAGYVTDPGPAHLVMCHPGDVRAGETLDGVGAARRRELDYLGSDTFAGLLRRQGLTLSSAPPPSLRGGEADEGTQKR